jgi:hypothetical protein
MNVGELLPLLDLARMRVCVCERLALDDHARAEIARMLDLHERGAVGHHDGGGDAELGRVIGDTLRVVASRHGDDASRLFRIRQRQQAVERSALLERRRELQVLELDPDLRAGDVAQRARVAQRRAFDVAFDGLGRRLDIRQRYRRRRLSGRFRAGFRGHGTGSSIRRARQL